MSDTVLMTQEEYLACGGSKCPKCGSLNIEGGQSDFDGTRVWCNVVCNDCEFEWTDEYLLSGYEPAGT